MVFFFLPGIFILLQIKNTTYSFPMKEPLRHTGVPDVTEGKPNRRLNYTKLLRIFMVCLVSYTIRRLIVTALKAARPGLDALTRS